MATWAAALLPTVAQAQGHTPYSLSFRSQAFQPIPIGGGPADVHPGSGDEWVHPLTFPAGFTFSFFDVEKSAAYISSNGWVSFTSATSAIWTNVAIATPTNPQTGNPNDMIAPFWDDLSCASFKTQVLGQAPSRTLVIEWPCYRLGNTGNTVEMQVWLFEGASTIEIHYGAVASPGTTTWTATMGIENASGTDGYAIPSASSGNNCGASCTPADWHTDTVVTFSQGPELRASDLEADLEGFAGIPMEMSVTASNVGGEPAADFTVRFWVNTSPTLDGATELITLENDIRSLEPRERTVYHAAPRLPTELEAGQYYLLAELDPFHNVPVSSRGAGITVFGPFTVGIRAANLAVSWVDAPPLVQPGDSIEVSWLAENTGNLATMAIAYQLVLSPTPSVSPYSMVIGSGEIGALAIEEQIVETTEVRIPISMEPGHYYIGVQMDPARKIFEHERRDNVAMSNPVVIASEDLAIVTEAQMPSAHYQGHYDVRLHAVGGHGSPEWMVTDDSILPPGLSLVTEVASTGQTSTFLRGVPAKKGEFSFTLLARSGPLEAEQTFTLDVSGGAYSLTVVTENLAEAAFGFEYEDHLAGSGGIPPYTWELVGGTALPQGIFLRSDGYLSGRPQEGGDFPVTFRLTDSQGLQTTKDLTLLVAPPNALTCVTKELPILQLEEFVRIPLIAAGGPISSYSWSTVSTVRLVSNIGESSTTLLDPPPGLRLDQGTVVGEPSSVGTYLWTLKVTAGSASTECPILIHVPSDHGLTVTTSGLPLAIAGRSYRAALDVAGGEGPYTWEFIDEQLAEALNMDFEAGYLVGNPPLDALGGEKSREFSFTVRVEDTKGRIGIGALTLHLAEKGLRTGAPEAEDDGGGCQTGSGDASLWGLALLGLALLRRRAN